MLVFNPVFDPSNFNSPGIITNLYFPLTPGTTLVYQGSEETIRFEVTYDTRTIAGVTCVVVLDQAYSTNDTPLDPTDDFLIEKTFDYFAQDKDGNVWYFGESVKNYNPDTGKLEDKEGSWLSGVKGALPGIIMMDEPEVGVIYNQENAPVAQDYAQVLAIDGVAIVPYGSFSNLLVTFDGSHLPDSGPDVLNENKYYATGIGLIQAVDNLVSEPDNKEVLVRIEFDGTSKDDTNITGNVGTDWLRGHDGNDVIRGFAGDDILTGGMGKDVLDGGADTDSDTFVYLDAKESLTLVTCDKIENFLSGTDKIDLSEIDGNTKMRGDQHFKFVGNDHGLSVITAASSAFSGKAGELYFDVGEHILVGDRNGDKIGDFFVELVGVVAISLGDLIGADAP